MLIYAYLQISLHLPYHYLSIKMLVPTVIHTNPQSASNWRTNTRARELERELTNSHLNTRLVIDHSPLFPKINLATYTENQVSAPVLPRNFNTFEQSNCLCRYKRARKADRRNRDADSLILPFDWTTVSG